MATHATRARLTTYASLAAATAAAAVGGTADASTVVSTALNGTVIGWNTGAGQTRTTTVTGFGGLGGRRLQDQHAGDCRWGFLRV